MSGYLIYNFNYALEDEVNNFLVSVVTFFLFILPLFSS